MMMMMMMEVGVFDQETMILTTPPAMVLPLLGLLVVMEQEKEKERETEMEKDQKERERDQRVWDHWPRVPSGVC